MTQWERHKRGFKNKKAPSYLHDWHSKKYKKILGRNKAFKFERSLLKRRVIVCWHKIATTWVNPQLNQNIKLKSEYALKCKVSNLILRHQSMYHFSSIFETSIWWLKRLFQKIHICSHYRITSMHVITKKKITILQ